MLYHEQIKDFENELKSEKFLYQTTPPFIYTIKNAKQSIEMTISNGIITNIKENQFIIDKKQFLGELFHSVYDHIQNIKTKISLPGWEIK